MIKEEVLSKLSSVNDYNILNHINRYCIHEDTWKNNKINRAYVIGFIGIADITFKTIIRRLLDQGHLIKVRRGVYKINQDILINNG